MRTLSSKSDIRSLYSHKNSLNDVVDRQFHVGLNPKFEVVQAVTVLSAAAGHHGPAVRLTQGAHVQWREEDRFNVGRAS